MSIDTHDLKYGFWVGLGLILAFALWHFITGTARKAAKRDG